MQLRSKARTLFRYLCLLTAFANAGGNVGILLFYRPIFALFNVPLPKDLHNFVFLSGFSFTVGVLAYLIFRDPDHSLNLLIVGSTGKAIYALFTFYFYFTADLHWFFVLFGVWDAVFAVIFLLFLIHLISPDLTLLNSGALLSAVPGPRNKNALLLYYSLTGNGAGAMKRVRQGLESKGYAVDEKQVEPVEKLFHFPFSLPDFVRIMLRAIFRRPARIKALGIAANHNYSLIVVESQTWFIGMSAPVEAVFQDPNSGAIFAGRDVATVNVCRGLWRRPQAQLVRWIEKRGGNVVGAHACANPGREPIRTFSLFFFLGAGKPGRPTFLRRILTPQRLSDEHLLALERFGQMLAERT